MSGEGSGPEWTTPERDRAPVRGSRVTVVLVGALAIFSAFVWVTWKQLQGLEHHIEPAGPLEPATLGQPEINLVNTGLMQLETRAYDEKNAQHAQLHDYGWVDRDGGVVHIPIEQGIERVLERQRRAGGGR